MKLEEAIKDIKSNEPTTCTINFWNKQIGAEGAKALAAALEQNTTLSLLYLENNQIGDKGAKAIAKALEQNTTLRVYWI